MKIRAAIARGPEAAFSIEAADLDEPRSDEILVRISAVGVCHTDLAFKDRQVIASPAVLGHEGAGTVERVGVAVTKVAPDDRVALTFRSCGECRRCTGGDPAYCYEMPALNYTGMRPDGSKSMRQAEGLVSSNFFGQSSFGTYALAYERNVIRLPEDIPFELAAPLGCGVQTGAGGVMLAMACPEGASLLVTGAGAVGLSAVMGGMIQGCRPLIVVEPHAARRALALELGATHALDPATVTDLAAGVRDILPHGVEFAFDTTGRQEILEAVMAALAPKGVFGIVGIPQPGAKLPGELGVVLRNGQTVRGIIEGDSDPDVFLPQLIDLWRQGQLPLEKLVRVFPFDEINAAIAAQHRGECVKVVLAMN